MSEIFYDIRGTFFHNAIAFQYCETLTFYWCLWFENSLALFSKLAELVSNEK